MASIDDRRHDNQRQGCQGNLLDSLDAGADDGTASRDDARLVAVKNARNDEGLVRSASHDPDVEAHCSAVDYTNEILISGGCLWPWKADFVPFSKL